MELTRLTDHLTLRIPLFVAFLLLKSATTLWASPTDTLPQLTTLSERLPHFYSADCPKFVDGLPTLEQLEVKICAEEAVHTYIYSNLVDPRKAQEATGSKRTRKKSKPLLTRVSFAVERDGSITEVKTVTSTGELCSRSCRPGSHSRDARVGARRATWRAGAAGVYVAN